MKKVNIWYWILTWMLVPALGIGSVLAIIGHSSTVSEVTSLGYPSYLSPFLGVARLLALAVILLPGYPRLKEWAYAGLVFDIVGAMYSLAATGHMVAAFGFPAMALGVVAASYRLGLKKRELV